MEWNEDMEAAKLEPQIVARTESGALVVCSWEQHNWLNGKPDGPMGWFPRSHDAQTYDAPIAWLAIPPFKRGAP